MRTTYLGLLNYSDDKETVIGLQRDDVHIAYTFGGYIVAQTFAKYLVPEELWIDGGTFIDVPQSPVFGELPVEYTQIAQAAVNAALQSPYTVTVLENYEIDPAKKAKEAIESASYTFEKIDSDQALIDAIEVFVNQHLSSDFAEPVITLESYTIDKQGNVTDLEAFVLIGYGYTTVTATISVHPSHDEDGKSP